MLKVIHHQRLPQNSQISIERLFEEIRLHLPESCSVDVRQSPFPSIGILRRVKNLIHAARQRADIHHIVGDVHYLAFGLSRVSTVLTIHDCASLSKMSGLRRAIFKFLWFTGPMKRASAITTISETSKSELRKWVGALADRIVVIPNCVKSEFSPDPKPFDDAQPTVLQVGTGWNKNVIRVADALRGTGCRLEIVGILKDDQRAHLEKCGVPFKELGRLTDDELLLAYKRSDLLVFASLYEGFGLPILEAQATGRAVITSNRSSMPEAAGEGALFIDPESPSSIRAAVQAVVNDSSVREGLITKGFENVQRYRAEAISRRYYDLYTSVNTKAVAEKA